jgi:NAD(P)-dependent dehydrogenase (short-subunit alcohol dehydrogenase family)
MTEIALITGANKGLGFETARQLGALGMTVLIGARDEQLGRAAGQALPGARFVHLDVTDEKLIEAARERIEAEYGRLDVLVNNAGIARLPGGTPGLPPSATEVDVMRGVFEVNVLGVIAVTNAMLPLLRRAPAGRIINVSSELGSIRLTTDPASPFGQMPPSLAYPVSKAALNMVTGMYAKELRDSSISVYLANPGYCATDLNGNTGFRSAAEGASVSVTLATGPVPEAEGALWGYRWEQGDNGPIPW